MASVFSDYLGLGGTLSFSARAYVFFLLTFACNIIIMSLSISKGIEFVAKYAMPALLVLGIVLAIRVLSLPPVEGRTVADGLAQIWRVSDWSVLRHSDVWIAATGQIFFTLSVGLGMVHSYASYLNYEHDVTLSGLTACTTNEFVEVILGGTIAIPAAVVFFGVADTRAILDQGTFAIGFHALPVIFQKMPAGQAFGVMWFILLFLAGLTSSMAMFTPLLLFLEDELGLTRRRAATGITLCVFMLMQPVVLFYHRGVLDELDYWMGDFCLVLFGALEAMIFAWIFGMKKGWAEMHAGADLQVPRIFYYVMKYITPFYAVTLVVWSAQDSLWRRITMQAAPPENVPFLWLARTMMFAMAGFLIWGVRHAWRTHPKFFEQAAQTQEAVK
jgi:SNF family Na+-dependent transporter